MSDILIAGKELPECLELAEGFTNTKKVFISAKKDIDLSPFESEGIYSTNWNKASAISARSFLITAETKMKDLNAATLETAMSMIAGTCRSMGVTVEG